MPKSLTTGAADAALNHVSSAATRMVLCAGAPTDASAAATAIASGGAMLAEMVLDTAAQSGFAISTTSGGDRRLTIGGQTSLMGVESGTADHLSIVSSNSGELLLVTELTEPQAVEAGQIMATRSFSLTVSEPT